MCSRHPLPPDKHTYVPPCCPQVDSAKRAVVFQRYYHLFVEGELEGLLEEALTVASSSSRSGVAHNGAAPDTQNSQQQQRQEDEDAGTEHGTGVGGRGAVAEVMVGRLVGSFYDKSNWCAVFERTAAELPAEWFA